MRQRSAKHAYYMLGVWGHGPAPCRKILNFNSLKIVRILGYFSVLLPAAASNLTKNNCKFCMYSDCFIRIFRFFVANKKKMGGEGRGGGGGRGGHVSPVLPLDLPLGCKLGCHQLLDDKPHKRQRLNCPRKISPRTFLIYGVLRNRN